MNGLRLRLCAVALAALAGCGDDDNSTAADAGADAGPDAGPDAGLALGLGDVHEIVPTDDGTLDVEVLTPAGDEQFVLQLVSLSRQPKQTYDYEVAVGGEALGAPVETGPVEHDLPASPAPPGWDAARAAVAAGARAARPHKADPPEVGELVMFEVSNGMSYVDIECEVMIVSDELVIVFDRTTTGDLTVDEAVLAEVAENFEQVVLPRERAYFGAESDVNEDGHVTMLFSPLVNTGSGGATAYVFPCDLLEPGAPGCPATNEQELIYMSPPDMLEPYMASAKAITETVAHEFQHAIYFYRKYILNELETADESMYVTEGMSAMAQDVSGFMAGNLYVAAAGIEDVNAVSLADVFDYPYGYDPVNDGVYRGAAYLILRYAFDRLGGDEIDADGTVHDLGGISFLGAMSELPLYGYEGFEAATEEDADVMFADFFTALLVDDRTVDGEPINEDPRYNFAPPWDDPVTGNPHGITMSYDLAGGSWQVRGVPLQQGGADGTVKSGGVEYVLIEAADAGGTLAIAASGEEDAALAARLIRIY